MKCVLMGFFCLFFVFNKCFRQMLFSYWSRRLWGFALGVYQMGKKTKNITKINRDLSRILGLGFQKQPARDERLFELVGL